MALLPFMSWREAAPGCSLARGVPVYGAARVAPVGEIGGARYKDRTCDPFDVNEVLYR